MPQFEKDYEAVQCQIVAESDAAICVKIEHFKGNFWFPLSQVSRIKRANFLTYDDSKYEDVVHVAKWILRSRGL